jgi:hypothetical protein
MMMEWGNITRYSSIWRHKTWTTLCTFKQCINANFKTLLFRMVGEYCHNLKSLLVKECHYITERSLGCLRNRIFIDKPDYSEYYRELDHPLPIMGLNMWTFTAWKVSGKTLEGCELYVWGLKLFIFRHVQITLSVYPYVWTKETLIRFSRNLVWVNELQKTFRHLTFT